MMKYFLLLMLFSSNSFAIEYKTVDVSASDFASLNDTLAKVTESNILEGGKMSCVVKRSIEQIVPASDPQYVLRMTVAVEAKCSGEFTQADLLRIEGESVVKLLRIPGVSGSH